MLSRMRRVNERYGAFQRASGVVLGAGYIYEKDEQEEDNCSNRTLNAYVLIYLLDGGGMFSSPACSDYLVNAGDTILLFPGVYHTYRRVAPHVVWSECFVEFSGEIFAAFERDGLINPQRPVHSPGLQPHLIAAFDELIRDYQSAIPGQEPEFSARALLLLASVLGADRKRHELQGDREFVTEACARLGAALDQKLEVAAVAAGMGMSERAFRRRFAAHAGISPARYRQLQRIAVARTMLGTTELTVDAIAERLGYCDVHFFIKQFKKHTGSSPGRFRRKGLGEPR